MQALDTEYQFSKRNSMFQRLTESHTATSRVGSTHTDTNARTEDLEILASVPPPSLDVEADKDVAFNAFVRVKEAFLDQGEVWAGVTEATDPCPS